MVLYGPGTTTKDTWGGHVPFNIQICMFFSGWFLNSYIWCPLILNMWLYFWYMEDNSKLYEFQWYQYVKQGILWHLSGTKAEFLFFFKVRKKWKKY